MDRVGDPEHHWPENQPQEAQSSSVEELKHRLEIYELIFDSIHNGSMVTDAGGYVTHFNKPYGEFLGLDPAAAALGPQLLDKHFLRKHGPGAYYGQTK